MSESLELLEVLADEARAGAVEEVANSPGRGRRGGPKTAEGLAASSVNSMRHGLTGSGIHLPAELRDEVVRWSAVFDSRYRPLGEEPRERVEAAALAFAQYRGAIAEQTRYLVRRSQDAVLNWDDRRIAEAEQLALKLPNRPGLVTASLRTSFRGSEWLLKRWKTLRSALDKKGDWNEEELALAMDLLGIDPIQRPYDPSGIASATADERHAIVEEQCRDLEARLGDDHAQLEESARNVEVEGKGYLLDKVYLKLERYARDAYRRYEKQIAFLEAHRKAQPKAYREATEVAEAASLLSGIPMPDVLPPSDMDSPMQAILALATRRPMAAPASPAPIAGPKPDPAREVGDDRGRELRADPAERTAIPRPKTPMNPEQRRQMEAALRKAAGSKPRVPR